MSIELIIGIAVVALLIAIYVKHREKPTPKDHVPPSLEGGVQVSKTPNGPKPAPKAEKAPAKKKAAPKKKTTKKAEPKKKAAPKKKVVKKKTTKKKTTKKVTKKATKK